MCPGVSSHLVSQDHLGLIKGGHYEAEFCSHEIIIDQY